MKKYGLEDQDWRDGYWDKNWTEIKK